MAGEPTEIFADDGKIEEWQLSDDVYAAIGKIAVIGSELDDSLSLAIFNISKTRVPDGYLIIGKQAISSKLATYEYLLKKYADKESIDSFKLLKPIFSKFLSIRNSVCHGIFIGRHKENDSLIFLRPSENYAPVDGSTTHKAIGLHAAVIIKTAELATGLLDFMASAVGEERPHVAHLKRLRRDQ